MKDHKKDLNHFRKISQDLRKACPEVMQPFGKLHGAAFKDGALSVKQKN